MDVESWESVDVESCGSDASYATKAKVGGVSENYVREWVAVNSCGFDIITE